MENRRSRIINDISHQNNLFKANSFSPKGHNRSQNAVGNIISQLNGVKINVSKIGNNMNKIAKFNFKSQKSLNKGLNEGVTSTGLGFTSTLQETINSIDL